MRSSASKISVWATMFLFGEFSRHLCSIKYLSVKKFIDEVKRHSTFDPTILLVAHVAVFEMSSVDRECVEQGQGEKAARAEELKNTANQFFKGISLR